MEALPTITPPTGPTIKTDGGSGVRTAFWIRAACVAAAVMGLVNAVPVLVREIAADALRAQARLTTTCRTSAAALASAYRRCGARCLPEAQLDAAVGWTSLAGCAGADERGTSFAAARGAVAAALAQRPRLGRAWAQLAFLNAAEGRPALVALQRSYAYAPFLKEAALWRTGYSSGRWIDLPPGVRERVMDEAAWLRTLPPDRGGRPDGGLGDGVAGLELVLRRPLTGTFLPVPEPAPEPGIARSPRAPERRSSADPGEGAERVPVTGRANEGARPSCSGRGSTVELRAGVCAAVIPEPSA